jgi:hypothetical protein
MREREALLREEQGAFCSFCVVLSAFLTRFAGNYEREREREREREICIPNKEISLVSMTIFALIARLSVSILVSPGPLNPHPLSPSGAPEDLGPLVNLKK